MRYFICALDKINLGIPAEQTERIISVNREQTIVYESGEYLSDSRGVFISLPALFRQKDTAVFHGLVMKSRGEVPAANDHARTILLMPKIDIDLEIPEDAIRQLPKTFAGVFSFFTGAYFETGNAADSQNLILILNPQKLMEVYHD
jgi:hypothetical protein